MLKIGATVLIGALALAGCNRSEPPGPKASSSPVAVQSPALPVSEPPIDRAALLMAVARAASATALGETDAQQAGLDGKRFSVRMRFGCPGSSLDAATRRWSFDEADHVLRIVVEPEVTRKSPELAWAGTGDFEDAEGYWIYRPWLLSAGCARPAIAASAGEEEKPPTRRPSPTSAPGPSPRIGIVQVYRDTDTRAHRRNNRSLQVTKALPDEATGEVGRGGFDLVIEGRLRALADRRVMACRADGDGSAPSCLVFAEFDRIAIEDPNGGEVLAEWSDT